MVEARAYEEEADRAAASGQFAAALALLEQAVDARSDSTGLWMKLSAMRKAMGDQNGALEALDRLLDVSPGDVPALLSRAVILDSMADPGAGEAYEKALALVPDDAEIPPEFSAITAHARKRRDQYRVTLEHYLSEDLPSDLTPAERLRAERLITNRSRNTLPYQQHPCDFHYPGMPAIEFHDREQFPGLDALEQATDAIRAEFAALLSAEVAEMVPYVQFPERVPLRQWKELNNNPQWTAIHLLQNGFRVEANARHCPRTLEAISKMDQPRVPGASPVAMFSLLAPHTRIPPHRGVSNTRLVCHLPLIVPADCGFRCGATTREWRVGEAFVFDDTIEHEAWNDSDELRTVLILDLWAPALGSRERQAVSAVIGASNRNFLRARSEG